MHSYSVPCRCYVRALECAMQCTKPEISAWSIQMAECQIVHLSICPEFIESRPDQVQKFLRSGLGKTRTRTRTQRTQFCVLRSQIAVPRKRIVLCAHRSHRSSHRRKRPAAFHCTLRRHAFPAVFCLRCLRPPRPGRTWHSACCCCCCCRCCCCCCPLRFAVAVSPRSSQHYITSTARPASPRLGVWAIICNVHLHSLLSADIFTYQSTTPQSLLCNISLQYL